MQTALRDFVIHGVVTNIDFMQAVLAHPDFAHGKVTTRWVERILESEDASLTAHGQTPSQQSMIAAALAEIFITNSGPQLSDSPNSDPYSPWKMKRL
jgi:pyruvate carboxylase